MKRVWYIGHWSWLALAWAVWVHAGASERGSSSRATKPWTPWDGHESIADYARRAKLPPTKTLHLDNGVSLELVLIPAGKFIMGTPEAQPVDEESFRKKIIVGQAVFAAGVGVLLVMVSVVLVRAIRDRRRPQYSLARFTLMIVVAGSAVLGGMHWGHTTKTLARARVEYGVAVGRYNEANDSEKPAHEVSLTRPFYIGKFEVTQEQYQQVMGRNPSLFKGTRLPVETVSWDDAQDFCAKVSEKTGRVIRLPTDAEWEHACQAGTRTRYYTGDTEADLGRAGWYSANSNGTPHPVGEKEPNCFGLFDLHGNVWEWCQDWYGKYDAGAVVDPQGPSEGQARVLRGGSWCFTPWVCRSACRYNRVNPDERSEYVGLRVACTAQ